ncbi:MAG: Tim44/TimA family putative adaptor protein [Defluviicoccus sp.]
MGDSIPYLDILLFAVIAAFLVFRLRSVLGKRTGHQGPGPGEPRRDPFSREPPVEAGSDRVVPLPKPKTEPALPGIGDDAAAEPATIGEGIGGPAAAGLTQIRIADPNFAADEFLSGARIAFELIVGAFAAGDADTLKPLLSEEVFNNFADSIRRRQETGQKLENQLVAIRSAEIDEAYMAGRTAHVTVKFVTDQISVVRDAEGAVVEGSPTDVNEVTDYWTFARDTRAGDPNWALVATNSPE